MLHQPDGEGASLSLAVFLPFMLSRGWPCHGRCYVSATLICRIRAAFRQSMTVALTSSVPGVWCHGAGRMRTCNNRWRNHIPFQFSVPFPLRFHAYSPNCATTRRAYGNRERRAQGCARARGLARHAELAGVRSAGGCGRGWRHGPKGANIRGVIAHVSRNSAT